MKSYDQSLKLDERNHVVTPRGTGSPQAVGGLVTSFATISTRETGCRIEIVVSLAQFGRLCPPN